MFRYGQSGMKKNNTLCKCGLLSRSPTCPHVDQKVCTCLVDAINGSRSVLEALAREQPDKWASLFIESFRAMCESQTAASRDIIKQLVQDLPGQLQQAAGEHPRQLSLRSLCLQQKSRLRSSKLLVQVRSQALRLPQIPQR